MEFQYIGYTEDRKTVKGKVAASSEAAALDLLGHSGYKVLTIKQLTPFVNTEKISAAFATISPKDLIMFSRQLALLIESGTDIVSALDLLRNQIGNRTLRSIVDKVVTDVRGGLPLSQALEKHPKAFSLLYCRTVAIAEETGNLESGLRQMADHLEKQALAAKKIKSALIYPIIVVILAIVVIAILVTFVMPAYMSLYSALGADLPAVTRALLAIVQFLLDYGLFLLIGIAAIVAIGFAYTRTPVGRYQWDNFKLKLPKIGPIIVFTELGRCCRTISLLFRAGVPLPEILTLAISGSNNKVVARALTEVREDMVSGEGLARPMAKNHLFLPLMVQMAAVGENTGNLDDTMDTVAQSYEMEADDRTNTLISLIEPAMTLFMGGLVGFIALALISTMYSMLGSIGV